ncbi:unnamed protein product [Symbiodinium sp. KB8]|nr:unnamed protein product [Symbiodinium sp. KB8]
MDEVSDYVHTSNATCIRDAEGSFEERRQRLEQRLRKSQEVSRADLVQRNIVPGVSVVRRGIHVLEGLLRSRPSLEQLTAANRLPPNYIDKMFPDDASGSAAPKAERKPAVSLNQLLSPPSNRPGAAVSPGPAGPPNYMPVPGGQVPVDPAVLATWMVQAAMMKSPSPITGLPPYPGTMPPFAGAMPAAGFPPGAAFPRPGFQPRVQAAPGSEASEDPISGISPTARAQKPPSNVGVDMIAPIRPPKPSIQAQRAASPQVPAVSRTEVPPFVALLAAQLHLGLYTDVERGKLLQPHAWLGPGLSSRKVMGCLRPDTSSAAAEEVIFRGIVDVVVSVHQANTDLTAASLISRLWSELGNIRQRAVAAPKPHLQRNMLLHEHQVISLTTLAYQKFMAEADKHVQKMRQSWQMEEFHEKCRNEYEKLFGRVGLRPLDNIRGGKPKPRYLIDRAAVGIRDGGRPQRWGARKKRSLPPGSRPAMALRPKRRKSSAKVLPPNISYVPDAGAAAAPSPGASPGEDSVILSMKPGPVVGTYTIADIKAKFQALDRNGDGILSREEMGVLLRRGRDDITDEELGVLWDDMNHDGDEGIDFDEFVDYLFGLYTSDGAKLDWRGASEVFHVIAGASNRDYITYHEYLALCRQLDILDDTGFGITEAMALFKECKESKRGMTFERFKLLVKKVSKKKNVPLRTVVNWIASFTPGRANEDIADTWTACHKQ